MQNFPESFQLKGYSNLNELIEGFCDTTMDMHDIVFMDAHHKLYAETFRNVYQGKYNANDFFKESYLIICSSFSWLKKFNYITMLSVFKLAAKRLDVRDHPEWYQRYVRSLEKDYWEIYELGAWNSYKFLQDFFYNSRENVFNREYPDTPSRKEWLLMNYDNLIKYKNINSHINMDRIIRSRVKTYILENN